MGFSDDSFFWSGPSIHPTTFRGFPTYSPEPQVAHRKQPAKTPSTAPKVVQIPVRFVGSEPSPLQLQADSRLASALKIQKIFRGFLVRRSMKKIIAVRKDVDEMGRRISQSETLDMICRHERERLRMNEMLMALLLKLDSVHGVDSGVRDCRRAAAKKVIALQERVDAIVSAVAQSQTQILGESKDDSQQNAEAVGQTLESTVTNAHNSAECGGQIDEVVVNFDHGCQESSENENKDACQGEVPGDLPNSENSIAENCEIVEEEYCAPETVEGICEVKEFGDRSDINMDDENCMDNEDDNFVMVDVNRSKEEEHCVEKETGSFPAMDEYMEESLETSQMKEEEIGKTDDNKRNQELLERMIGDNQKMMNMMSQLCEKNEMQTKQLNSLTRRVELLEKAFVCHILKRKKGRHSE